SASSSSASRTFSAKSRASSCSLLCWSVSVKSLAIWPPLLDGHGRPVVHATPATKAQAPAPHAGGARDDGERPIALSGSSRAAICAASENRAGLEAHPSADCRARPEGHEPTFRRSQPERRVAAGGQRLMR